MQKIAVLTDSGCDVPRSAAETYNIHILPLKITYSGKTYTDNVDITPRDVYDRFPKEIPKTSTPNGAEIADMLRRSGKPVVLAVNKVDSGEKVYDTFQFYALGLG